MQKQIYNKGADIKMDGCPAYNIVVFGLFIILNIIMYGFSSAVRNINEKEVRDRAEEGHKSSIKLLKLIEEPSKFINTIQLTATCIAVITGVVQAGYFIGILNKILSRNVDGRFHSDLVYALSGVLVIMAILALILSIGVMVPKKLGLKYSKSFSYRCVNFIYIIMFILYPFTKTIEIISNIILRILRVDPNEEYSNVTEDEIISIVNEGHEMGVLEESEAEMISNIMELDDKNAGDIMTHRKNIVAVDGEASLEQAVNFMLEANNSRFPVFIDDIDNIIGIVHLRDAVRCLNEKTKNDWLLKDIPKIIREARFIPETRNINTLFKEMQSEKIHMEIVIDEYGQTAGIVAMEDILEEIVGNIMDEYDTEDTNIVKQSENVYLVKGMTTLEQIEDELGMKFEQEEYDTLNGYLISKLDRIPSEEDNTVINEYPYTYEIMAVENNMITLVKISIEEKQEESEEDANEEIVE